MIDLGGILPSLVENIGRVSPVWPKFIRPYERGVRFSRGSRVKLLDPGVHFVWNWWQDVELVSVAAEVVESQKLTLTTKDRQTVIVSLAINYQIVDPVAYWLQVQDPEKSILNAAEGEASRVVCECTADEILLEPQAVADGIASKARRLVKPWGVTVNRVSLPNLAMAKAFRLVGDL